jgi:uncharacterized membrane protein
MNPIKPTIKSEALPMLMVLAAIVLSYFFYARFPDQVPTHWNWAGEPDAYSSKEFGAFFFPALVAGIYLLFLALPYLDPKKERYADFRKVYHVFKNVFVAFMLAIYVIAGLSGLGYDVAVGKIIPLMVGGLFILIGNYFGKIRFNWFVGIKTPWTLSSEEVWNKTHRLGGKLFMLAGLMVALTPWLPRAFGLAVFLAAIVIAAPVPMVYSYVLYAKVKQGDVNSK